MTTAVLQIGSVEWTQTAVLQLVGLGLAAVVVAAVLSLVYRRRTTRPLPSGTGAFLGFSTVAAWLLVEALAAGSLVDPTPIDHYASGIYGVGAAVLGALAGAGGRRLGDRVACDVYDVERLDADGAVAELLRSARVLVAVELPEAVEDADGYLPVDEETRRALAEAEFLFPRRLSGRTLADRIETRIRSDFDVDHVSVTLEGDTVSSIAVGRHRSGLGPTLPSGTVAVAIRADPGGEVSPGDRVEVWLPRASDNQLVARGRLRSTDGDRTTLVVDEDDALALRPGVRYRLVTPPDSPSDYNRLVALLRSSPETTVALEVTSGSDTEGEFVGWLPGTVLALERESGVEPLPEENVTLQEGDTVYLFGRPDELGDLAGVGRSETAGRSPPARSSPAPNASDD